MDLKKLHKAKKAKRAATNWREMAANDLKTTGMREEAVIDHTSNAEG